MANVYPLRQDDTHAPPKGDVVIQTNDPGAAQFDVDSGTVQVELPDGAINISFGEPEAERKSADFDDNLAEHLSESELTSIAERLMLGIETDEQSRTSWLENAANGISLLGLEVKNPRGAATGAAQTPSEGTSNIDHPLLLESVLRFQANARGELLPADGPVKVKNDGEETELTQILARALEKDMNHFLTRTAKEYIPDTDRMLLLLGFCGISFKKGYHDPIKRRPVIASIDAKDLIVSNATTDLDSAGRVTHRIMMRPSVLKRMQMLGAYRDIGLSRQPVTPLKNAVDEKINQVQGIMPIGVTYETADLDRELYECYCEIEVPGFEHEMDGEKTGLPLPYKVVIDKEDRKILEIRREWEEDDPLCLPRNRIIAYIFIPGLGFYGIGLLNVLGNATKAVTAAWRLMLDAGMFANFPGFLYLKQFAKQFTNQFRIPPGGGQPIDAMGNDIRAAVMPLPYKDPSAVFIQLIENISTTAQRVGGTAELQIGEGKQDAPVGTTLAMIEQAIKLMGAVHKRLHFAQSQELELLKTLLMEDPEALWRHNKKSAVLKCLKETMGLDDTMQDQAEDARRKKLVAALSDFNLVPAADPNTSSQTERYLKVMAMRQMAMTNPSLDIDKIDSFALRTIGVDDAQNFFKPPPDPNAPPPSPPPEVLMAQASQTAAQARIMDAQTRMQESQTKAATAAQDQQTKGAELQMKDQIARLGVAREMVIHEADQRKDIQMANMQRQSEGVENQRDRAHQLRLAALGHVVDLHKSHQGVAADIGKARAGHEMGVHKVATDQAHKFNMQGLAHVHEAQQAGLDREHEMAMQEAEPPPAKPATKERSTGGRVVADTPSADDPTLGLVISSTIQQLRDAANADVQNTQVAGALRDVARTMREMRKADVVASQTVNTNTFTAINRLATTLKNMADKQDQQPQTLAALNRLSTTLKTVADREEQQPRTLAAINRLATTIQGLRSFDAGQAAKEIAHQSNAQTTAAVRASEERALAATRASEARTLAATRAIAGQATAAARASEERTLSAISHLSNAVRDLRASDATHTAAHEERTGRAMTQLAEAVRDLRGTQDGGNAETLRVMTQFEQSLQSMRGDLSRGSNTDNSQMVSVLEQLVASMRQPRSTDNGTPEVAEQMRRFLELQSAPRVAVRDASGRIIGMRIEPARPATATPSVNPNTDGTIDVEVDK